jgi:hypothetical protein
MTPELPKSQAALEQLADLNQTLEKEKVQLTPEVEKYVRNHVRAVQDKLQAGKDVYENELEFIPIVKMWMKMPKEWREKYPSIEDMTKSEELLESNKRHISIKQWCDLMHVAEVKGKKKDWIDKTFTFENGKIKTEEDISDFFRQSSLRLLPDKLEIKGHLDLRGCRELTLLPEEFKVTGYLDIRNCEKLKSLPNGLRVGSYLWLRGCLQLTSLPEDLIIGGDLFVSLGLREQVLKDAEKLKSEGKIGGEIIYEN